MKTLLICTLSFLFVSSAMANPIKTVTCEPGGEYGNNLNIMFEPKLELVRLTIFRKNPGSNYERDLTTHKGGNYRLDLSSHGGIQGYKVVYKSPETGTNTVSKGDLDCTTKLTESDAPTESTTTAEASTPAPSETVAEVKKAVEENTETQIAEKKTEPVPSPLEKKKSFFDKLKTKKDKKVDTASKLSDDSDNFEEGFEDNE